MPVHPGTDSKGSYYQWGGHGKKYYYKKGNKASKAKAKKRAGKQGAAAHASGYKGNDMFQKVTANFTGTTRNDTMAGRDYLVAPMVMIVEGVHDGTNGPLLYPADELARAPQIWNHKPIVVYHPERGGSGVSACDPDIISKRSIGVVMNTKFEETENGPGLKAEAWLEEDRMDAVDERIGVAIENGEVMELSTGLFSENEKKEGDWKGKRYIAIVHNMMADHLALLPDLKGACSVEDGAGFLRLNAKPGKITMINNSMSHANIRSLLNSWLQDKSENAWIEAVYDDFFVYEDDAKYYKYKYSLVDNQITIIGDAEEVIRVTEWRTLDGKFVGNEFNTKEKIMTKKELIDALISNAKSKWTEDDRPILMKMHEKTLAKISFPLAQEAEGKQALDDEGEQADDADGNKAESNPSGTDPDKVATAVKEGGKDVSGKDEVAATGEIKPIANVAKIKTPEEYIKGAPAEMQGVLNGMLTSYRTEKEALIARIIGNERNTFTKEQLEKKEVAELKHLVNLAASAAPEENQQNAQPIYDGQGNVLSNVANAESEPLIAPTIKFETPAA